jgi:predicted TIM-barrel fold metal-dependent hydrolase
LDGVLPSHGRPLRRPGIERDYFRDPEELFRQGRPFVTFDTDEDLPYLLRHLGEDALMMSSDYPHGDPSGDELFMDKLALRQDLSDEVKEKLAGGNAARFYRV